MLAWPLCLCACGEEAHDRRGMCDGGNLWSHGKLRRKERKGQDLIISLWGHELPFIHHPQTKEKRVFPLQDASQFPFPSLLALASSSYPEDILRFPPYLGLSWSSPLSFLKNFRLSWCVSRFNLVCPSLILISLDFSCICSSPWKYS